MAVSRVQRYLGILDKTGQIKDLCRVLRAFGSFHNKTEIKSKAEELLCCELQAFLTNGTSDFCQWRL